MKSAALITAVVAISAAVFAEEAAPVQISVSKEGTLHLGTASVTLEQLDRQLAELAKNAPHGAVIISSADDAPLKAITEVLDACRKNGFSKIRLQSDHPQK